MKILMLWLVALTSVAFAETSKVTVDEAEKLATEGIQILDVRTEKEWKAGHIEKAIRVDVLKNSFEKEVIKALDPKKPVLVYCRSGGRSARAVKAMEALGFEELADMKGGFTAWKSADKKVVK